MRAVELDSIGTNSDDFFSDIPVCLCDCNYRNTEDFELCGTTCCTFKYILWHVIRRLGVTD